ncbi:MAG TPA: hypothetical protein VF037_12435 [Gemmatimonadales bacterium]
MPPVMIPPRYRSWTLGLYLLAALLFLQPFIEAAAATWPPRLGEVGWRFASVGILYTMLPTLLFSLLLAATAAFLLEHRTVLRVIGAAALVLAVAIVLLSTGFVLDAVQLRRIVRPDARGGYDLTTVKALVTAIVAITGCAMLGVGAFRATRRLAGPERSRRRAGEGLLIGQEGRRG